MHYSYIIKNELGDNITDEKIKEYVLNTLSEGKVIPGYGHAVLRHTDPRFLHQKAFAEKFIKGDPLVSLVRKCYRVVPGILRTLGKVKNPWPNVDAHSGVLLNHHGLKEYDFYTVVFAVSRALGCMANLILARGIGNLYEIYFENIFPFIHFIYFNNFDIITCNFNKLLNFCLKVYLLKDLNQSI